MSRLVVFWSPGGSGASTLLLNTAAALGARRVRLAAADFNLITPSLALYTDLLPHHRPDEACLSRLLPALSGGGLTPGDLDRAVLTGPGFMLLPGMIDVAGASRLTEEQIRHLAGALLERFDLVLADVTPAMDSIACLPLLELAEVIVLVSGPELAARFHTRRNVIPLRQMGWESKTALVLNRADRISEAQAEQDIGLPVVTAVPELKMMPNLIEAGRVAYTVNALLPAAVRFRQAADRLGALVLRGGFVPSRHTPAPVQEG